jgi:5-methylcytosine-specific restriction enzyme B
VFGELFYSLEYRGEPVTLQYADEGVPAFQLPDNLLFIGTMNNADRSIAAFDAALRRRFYFVDFAVGESPMADALAKYLDRTDQLDFSWLAPFLEGVNEFVTEPDYAVGPSYFMRPDLDDEVIIRAWRHAILPYLLDRFPDLRDEAGFDFDTLRSAAFASLVEAEDEPTPIEHVTAPLAATTTIEN